MGSCMSSDGPVLVDSQELPEPWEFEKTKSRLSHLIVIGDVTPNSARVWVRVPTVGQWKLVLSKYELQMDSVDVDGFDSASQVAGDNIYVHEFSDKDSLTHCFHCDELEADTRYYYRVSSIPSSTSYAGAAYDSTQSMNSSSVAPIVLNQDEVCFLRTAKKNYKSVSVGFYSCHDPFSMAGIEYEPGAWHPLSQMAGEIDLIIGGGDQVYLDSNSPGMTDLWIFLRDHQHLFYKRFVGSKKNNGNQQQSFREHGFRLYMVQIIRQYYLMYWNSKDISNVFGRVPTYMMWDDHEIMDGWGSLTPQEKIDVLKLETTSPTNKNNEEKKKNTRNSSISTSMVSPIQDDSILALMVELTFQACAQVYNEFQHCRNPSRRPFMPIRDNPTGFEWDYSFQRGPEYQFYTMDMRGNHDCTLPADRLLGRSQHERILAWLDSAITKQTRAIFITSPVPFVHWSSMVEYSVYFVKTLKDDLMDAWSHPTNHVERDKILTSFFYISNAYKIPLVILCGDVHCMSAYTLTDPKRFPNAKIITITASAISRKPCPSLATSAFQGNGLLKTKPNDGKGIARNTTVHCEQNFAKSGVHNYAVVKAEGINISCTFCWLGKSRKELKQETVKF